MSTAHLVTSTALADEVVARLRAAFETAADPDRAPAMVAYLKGHFPFLGIPAPERRGLAKAALAGMPAPTETDVAAVATACWALDEREFQYAGVDYCMRWVGRCSPAFLPVVEDLLTTKSWWDTIDPLATRVVGSLVTASPELRVEMDRWLVSDDFWLARSALLHQLGYKSATDADWLFAACLRRAADTEFFLRKAIGWALREYSKTDEAAVRRFVATHENELSGLSRREALKWLDRRAARASTTLEARAVGIRQLSPPEIGNA